MGLWDHVVYPRFPATMPDFFFFFFFFSLLAPSYIGIGKNMPQHDFISRHMTGDPGGACTW